MSDWSDAESTPAPAASWDPSPPRASRGRGRGSGGGDGGGGVVRACYKCNEEGHIGRECPNQPGGSHNCHQCGDQGHMARDCPTVGSGGRACYKCGEDGHVARECPTGGGGGGGSRACHKCGEEGHMAPECPTSVDGGGGSRACHKCGEEGHMTRECPSGGGYGGSRACRKCGEEGHFARECPQNTDDVEARRPRRCYNCGEEGHLSKDCTNPRNENAEHPPRRDGGEGGEDDPTKERYVPPEMPEGDAIFEERSKVYDGSGINFSKYSSIAYKVTGSNPAPSVTSFKGLGLHDLVLANVERCGYKDPTPVQMHGSPQFLAGRHVMCCTQTGSGKTAAFLLPIINRLLQQQDQLTPAGSAPATPEALILAPTRELAIQIGNEANMYATGSMVRIQVVYGGTAIYAQKIRLQKGCNIMIATTGRLRQFMKENIVKLNKVKFFVLDEADRMLDMGFMPDVDEIVEQLPPKDERVSGLFSATFPDEIQEAAKKYLDNYMYIVIGILGGACADVVQEFVEIEKKEKRNKIIEIIKELEKSTKVLVFCTSKKGADFLATQLSQKQISTTSIHGDRFQSQREQALREFTLGMRQVLVATAVAARGLDIPKVGVVINYDLPTEIDEYVHRIGRTGRVGHTGRAISFYDHGQDNQLAAKLKPILEGAGQSVPDFISAGGSCGGFDGGFNSMDTRENRTANGTVAGGGSGGDEEDEW